MQIFHVNNVSSISFKYSYISTCLKNNEKSEKIQETIRAVTSTKKYFFKQEALTVQ